jgi:hypothetical protein
MSSAPHPRSFFILYVIRDFLIGVILLYGYVYAAYKYGNPLLGGNDFFKYKEMVETPFDFSATTAPFVLRQIPALVASIFYKFGFHYDTEAVVDLLGFSQSAKREFLSLILSNALAVCLSLTLLAGYVRMKFERNSILDLFTIFGLFAAWFYFPTAVVAPLTVGWGWLAATLFLIAFMERHLGLTCLACLIGSFSRETTVIFALVIFSTALLFEGERNRNFVLSVVVLIATCGAYLVIRTLATSGYEHQIAPSSLVSNLMSLNLTRSFLFQSVLSQGLLVVLLLGIALRKTRHAFYLLLASTSVAIVALAAGVSQISRLLGEALPFYVAYFLFTNAGLSPYLNIHHEQTRRVLL